MRKITILALDGAASTTVTAPMDVFQLSGVLWNVSCGEKVTPYFEVEVVTPRGIPAKCLNQLAIEPHRAMEDVEKTDLVIISAILNIDETLSSQGEIVPWLKKMYANGSQLASVCSGTFVLAETGLLDGKDATTHWGIADEFRRRYPKVLLKPERLFTDAGGIYCSGAFNSCIDLSIYLVEKFAGHRVAVKCAKSLVHDIGRVYQSPYTAFNFQRNHNDNEIKEAQRVIEKRYSKNVCITTLAQNIGLGRRAFERRFKAATGDTPLTYLQRVRVDRAKKILETDNSSFDQISYEVGYEDSSYFRKVFVKVAGIRPSEYRSRFQRAVHLQE